MRDLAHRGLRDCLLASSPSPGPSSPLSPLTKLLWKPLRDITRIVVLGAIQAGRQHQEASLATLSYLSGKDPAVSCPTRTDLTEVCRTEKSGES